MESTLSKQRTERFGRVGAYIIDIMSRRGSPRSNSDQAELAALLKPTLLRCTT